jgi:hypothetical protein
MTNKLLAAAGSALAAAALIAGGTSALAADSLAAPTLVAPQNGATLTSAQWGAADWSDVDASSTPVSYFYESSDIADTNSDGSFSSPVYQSGALSDSQIDTSGTAEGTYFWHVRAQDSMGSSSPWSATYSVTVDNDATTTPPDNGDAQALIDELQDLQSQFPNYYWNLQWLIDDLADNGGGTTTPPQSGTPSIDQANTSVMAGGAIDFVGRNFGHEQDITITMGGQTVGHAHADGGGNFSTGSMQAPSSAGTYTYTFSDQSGGSATATLTVH